MGPTMSGSRLTVSVPGAPRARWWAVTCSTTKTFLFEPAVRVDCELIPTYVCEVGVAQVGTCEVGAYEVGTRLDYVAVDLWWPACSDKLKP